MVGGSCGGVGAVGAGGGSGWGCLMSWWVGVGGRSCVIGASGRGKYGRWDVGSVWCGLVRGVSSEESAVSGGESA